MEIKISVEELRKRKLFVATPMYGGQCSGMFAKSIADLSAICVQHGIQLQMYFLFNESLITRARNYCCDEFMRSEATHLLFIDSDIGFNPQDVIALLAMQSDESPYDIIGAPYPKKSCHYSTKVTTEDGSMTIGKIVKNKYTGKVLSFSTNRGFEYQPIVAHHKTAINGKRWVRLELNRDSYGKMIVTADHEIATVENLFNPEICYIEAEKMDGRYVVRTPKINKKLLNENTVFTADQLAFLYGTLLGDSSIRKNGQLTCAHSLKSETYAKLKADLFGLNLKHCSVTLGEKHHAVVNIFGATNAQTKELRRLLYTPKKSVEAIVERLDVRGLAMLYMDDGYYCKHSDTAFLCTEGFNSKDVQSLLDKLTQLGYQVTRSPAGNQAGDRIRFKKHSAKQFYSDIAQYVIPEMEYKLPVAFHGGEKFDYQLVSRGTFSLQPVKKVVRLNDSFDQYDITVAENFNFVTQGTLIHNCIAWEKIKHAVDKGFGDEDPEKLGNFVGDYVFNPKGGQTTIPLGEPVEVLEIGTGFMMIRKNTLKEFVNKFPQYYYKPDHVRTEHFDGTREIMQFFQAEIDPVSKRYLSEDYWFCQKVQTANLKTWLCPWMKLQHVGSMVYGGSLIDLAQLGASATADAGVLNEIKQRKKQK